MPISMPFHRMPDRVCHRRMFAAADATVGVRTAAVHAEEFPRVVDIAPPSMAYHSPTVMACKQAAEGVETHTILMQILRTLLEMRADTQVMPAHKKSIELSAQDDAMCQHYAAAQVEGEAAHANWIQLAVAGGGTILGAGLGAAIGGGHGAAIGAGAGALGGAVVSSVPSASANQSPQQRYDQAYIVCQYTRGNHPPGMPPQQQARGRRL